MTVSQYSHSLILTTTHPPSFIKVDTKRDFRLLFPLHSTPNGLSFLKFGMLLLFTVPIHLCSGFQHWRCKNNNNNKYIFIINNSSRDSSSIKVLQKSEVSQSTEKQTSPLRVSFACCQASVRGGNCPLSLTLQFLELSSQFALLHDGQRVSELDQLPLQPQYLPQPLALPRGPPFRGGGGRYVNGGRGYHGQRYVNGGRGCHGHGLRAALGFVDSRGF